MCSYWNGDNTVVNNLLCSSLKEHSWHTSTGWAEGQITSWDGRSSRDETQQ